MFGQDAQEVLRQQCAEKKECASLKERLDACNARVESRTKTSETCVEEVIDFMHCVDHCVSVLECSASSGVQFSVSLGEGIMFYLNPLSDMVDRLARRMEF